MAIHHTGGALRKESKERPRKFPDDKFCRFYSFCSQSVGQVMCPISINGKLSLLLLLSFDLHAAMMDFILHGASIGKSPPVGFTHEIGSPRGFPYPSLSPPFPLIITCNLCPYQANLNAAIRLRVLVALSE